MEEKLNKAVELGTNIPKDKIKEGFECLDDLRDSGVVNMFEAPLQLQREFGWPISHCREIVALWMRIF